MVMTQVFAGVQGRDHNCRTLKTGSINVPQVCQINAAVIGGKGAHLEFTK